MTDEDLRARAAQAGIALTWRDQRGEDRAVSAETLRALLAAMGDGGAEGMVHRPLVTALAGEAIAMAGIAPGPVQIRDEEGRIHDVEAEAAGNRVALPGLPMGYHSVTDRSGATVTLAVAPQRCPTIRDTLGGRGWGPAVQIYSLRTPGDGGIGTFGGVAALGEAAARCGADAITVSPVHALFAAAPGHVSPYSPSTRLFINPLHADPALVLPADTIARAIAEAGIGEVMDRLETLAEVDWLAATPVKRRLIAELHRLVAGDIAGADAAHADFRAYRAQASQDLQDHAVFEVLHGALVADGGPWHWRDWPEGYRSPRSAEVAAFAVDRLEAVEAEIFAQWLAERSRAEAQRRCREAGMRIGMIADLAIGVEGAGSQAWSHPETMMRGISIGAPPDYYSETGQSWGLTTFSPPGLVQDGFAGFIAMLRANLGAAGGLRIDHVMGLERLWMVPEGASATEGAYVAMPAEDLYRLTALEAHRHEAVIIGEDLGTLPYGYREALRDRGMAGMRVLRFERDGETHHPPEHWDADAIAMSSTHDMIATAGWWRGADLEGEGSGRAQDRAVLWRSLQRSGVVSGAEPPPHEPEAVVDAAIAYVAATPSALAVVAVEDLLGLDVQPNAPGTTTEKPNWRHRLPVDSAAVFDHPGAVRRAEVLARRREA
jgi:4-alpha-glucanotransferase